MRLHFRLYRSWRNFLASAALIAVATPGLRAQAPTAVPPPAGTSDSPNLPLPAPLTTKEMGTGAAAPMILPGIVPPSPGFHPPGCPVPNVPPGITQPFISPAPSGTETPGGTAIPGDTAMPGGAGTPGGTGGLGDLSGDVGGQQGLADTGLGQGGSGQGGLEAAGGSAGASTTFVGAGYVDTAIPLTQYRLRIDAANGNNRPDRADFFYPECGCFRDMGNPNAPGPGDSPASKVNFEEVHNYLEIAVNRRFSAFVDVPFRWVDIDFTDGSQREHNMGLSDIQFGFKAALIYQPSRVLTFQLRTYAPSGNASLGLGRNNWNVEPGFLYYQRLGSRFFFEGELLDFIPVASADDFAGNVLQWGGALSYLIYNQPNFRVAPVTEMVGWNVLSGKESNEFGELLNAAGNTIVNAKFGLRVGFGELVQPGFVNRADWYVGYGRALTGTVWYKNMFRTELRIRF